LSAGFVAAAAPAQRWSNLTNTLAQFKKRSPTSAKRPSVYVARGPRGLETAVAGSIGSEVVDLAGARNVVGKDAGPRAIVDVSPEQILAWQPDVILSVDRRF
jgi:iron complex transport system substrate-binding protein